jgi:hypothetical protein
MLVGLEPPMLGDKSDTNVIQTEIVDESVDP